GQLEHAQVVDEVTKRFGALDAGSRPTRLPPTAKPRRVAVLRRRSEQVHIAIGVPSLTLYDEDRWAADVMEHILGGGASSRLFQSIREERGLAYSVYAHASQGTGAGQPAVSGGTAAA